MLKLYFQRKRRLSTKEISEVEYDSRFMMSSSDSVVESNNSELVSRPLKGLKNEVYSIRSEMMFPAIGEKEKECTIDRITWSYWIAIDSCYE